LLDGGIIFSIWKPLEDACSSLSRLRTSWSPSLREKHTLPSRIASSFPIASTILDMPHYYAQPKPKPIPGGWGQSLPGFSPTLPPVTHLSQKADLSASLQVFILHLGSIHHLLRLLEPLLDLLERHALKLLSLRWLLNKLQCIKLVVEPSAIQIGPDGSIILCLQHLYLSNGAGAHVPDQTVLSYLCHHQFASAFPISPFK